MDKRITYSTSDGGVAVIVPAPDSGLTIEEIASKDVPAGVAYEIVDAADIPSDRNFRDAWERDGRAIRHNMVKAKNIAHERRRVARAAEFAPLDVEVTIPSKSAQAEAARQAVRDKYSAMQSAIDSAQSIDQIKAALMG